ncbi:MAG: KinB-signaling pathway activation protein [Tuberibacillus sp.]
MNIRKWVTLFWKTLILGIIVYFVTGCIAQGKDILNYISTGDPKGVVFTLVNFVIFGGLFSVISQMGFFAYLTVHRIALGMFRSYWNMIQWVLMVVTFFDLVYFRYINSEEHSTIWFYLILPLILAVVSYLVAQRKKRETNQYAYVPTLFFMFVITTVEWLVGLLHNSDTRIIWEIGLTLMACNAYQVLTLHRLIKKD